MFPIPESVTTRLANAPHLWLFLDYDGTLADFSPTPEIVVPDSDLIALIACLAGEPGLRVAIVSGRRLDHSEALLPVPGIYIAGAYGIEIRTPQGEILHPPGFEAIRPVLQGLKSGWSGLLGNRPEYYLEDKRWTLAIHANNAPDAEASQVLDRARKLAEAVVPPDRFRVLGGNKFLEVAPLQADKGKTVVGLLEKFPFPGAELVYLGDDDKDELAFEAIRGAGGVTVVVSAVERPTLAEYRLADPAAVRAWLRELSSRRGPARC